jgi:tetratricopeptide (TPR) repeat protein
MGSESSPTASSRTVDRRSRPLWQVPVFLVGVTALAVAWFVRPPADSGPRRITWLLNRARQNLNRPDGDAEAAARDAQQAIDMIEVLYPGGDRAGEGYLLLGTARMRLGDRTPGEAGRPSWNDARKALQEAEKLGVPAAEQGHLRYRLAKVAFHLGDDPLQVAKGLSATAEEAEDRAEAYDLACEAFLRLTPPDYQKALEANTKLREQSMLRDDLLARAKLRSGELKLKLGRTEEARKDLELIGPSAPAAVLSRARVLRARSYQEESKWAEAAALWQAELADSRQQPGDRSEILYLLGVCHRKLDQVDEAAKVWDECVRANTGSPECVAAAVQLVEVRLNHKQYAQALDLLKNATAKVQKPEDWTNAYVDRAALADAFEKSAKAFREAGEFELAMQLAGHFEHLAAPGRAVTLRAEVATEWARKRTAPADGSKVAPEEEQAARDLFSRAASAYLDIASGLGEEARADSLWQAAGRFVEGKDLAKAVTTLDLFLKTEKRPDRLGEGWFLLGEVRRQSKDNEGAEAAYIACVKYQTPFMFRARYELAMLYWQAGQVDQARDILVQNVQDLHLDHDRETLEKSLYALGNFAYLRHDYAEVVKCLEEVLKQAPANRTANQEQTRARYQLANSFRQLAAEAKRDEVLGDSPNPEYLKHLQEKHRHFLDKAAGEYEELAKFLETPESAGHLTPDERHEVPFTAAKCQFDLGEYAKALAIYEHMIETTTDLHVTMQALGCAANCHYGLREQDKAQLCLEQIRKNLPSLERAEQKQWEEWLNLAPKPAVR